MYSKSSQGSRGSVQTKVSNGRLQLVFSHPVVTPSGELKNKRFYLSTRHDDTPFGRQQASTLAAKIQRDIDYGEFDASLVKYKPAASLSTLNSTRLSPTPLVFKTVHESFQLTRLLSNLVLVTHTSLPIYPRLFQVFWWA